MKQNCLFKHSCALLMLHLVCASGVAQHHTPRDRVTSPRLEPGMENSFGEEIVEAPVGFSAVLTLDDKSMRTLLQQGKAEISIPQQLIGSVEAVVLRRPVVFKDNEAKEFAEARLEGQRLVIDVDQEILSRISYQPVQLNIYETGFSSVVLNYVPQKKATSVKKLGDAERDSPVLTLKLKSGNAVTGKIKDLQELNLDSAIGNILVELSQVSKIEFQNNDTLKIEMDNGDLITGKIAETEFVLINRWDTETIPLKDVAAVIIQDNDAVR